MRHISMLRKTLNDNLTEHLYIVTVAGRGYRFVAEVDDATVDAARRPRRRRRRSTFRRSCPSTSDAPSRTARRDTCRPRARRSIPAARGWIVPSIAGAMVGRRRDRVLDGRGAAVAAAVDRSLAQFTFEPGSVRTPSWSPDGRWIAFSSDRGGNVDIWVQPTGPGTATRLTDSPAIDDQPAWSPDGKLIAFRSERDGGGLFVAPAGGGAGTPHCELRLQARVVARRLEPPLRQLDARPGSRSAARV